MSKESFFSERILPASKRSPHPFTSLMVPTNTIEILLHFFCFIVESSGKDTGLYITFILSISMPILSAVHFAKALEHELIYFVFLISINSFPPVQAKIFLTPRYLVIPKLFLSNSVGV